MPKARTTCTRCSQRRQKCDRKQPCSRCIQNKEGHLCTREWPNGYNPDVHRRYPKRADSADLSTWPRTPSSDISHRSEVSGAADHPAPGDDRHHHPPSTSIDFVTYGRTEDLDINLNTLLAEKDPFEGGTSLSQSRTQCETVMTPATTLSTNARSAEALHIQSLLPSRHQVFEMVDYHERDMLYWTGGCYHGPTFRRSLVNAYGQSSTLQLQHHDWRWTALLFSILSASVIASPEHISASWGYSSPDKVHLSKQWRRASVSCLLLGDYTSKFHIYSIQAIMNLHSSEHLVGSSKEYTVLQACALAIAKGLGLHRLVSHPDEQGDIWKLSEPQKEALIQREIGRRVWNSLAFQDWLCLMAAGMYSIQPKHFTSSRPGFYDDATMLPVGDTKPTYSHGTNYLTDLALLLVEFHDEILDQSDLSSKYNVVLKYDGKIRSHYTEHLPSFFSYNVPLDPTWPKWVSWARKQQDISAQHKIIMIHQSFLGRSFKDARYTYTRWACTTAAKHIIDAMMCIDNEGPQWWIEQAFLVTAGICLGLDVFHRTDTDFEVRENKTWVEKAIVILQRWPNSTVATHGSRLLASLLHERTKKTEGMQTDTSSSFPTNANTPLPEPFRPVPPINASTSIPAPVHGATQFPSPDSLHQDAAAFSTEVVDSDAVMFEQLMESFPFEAGLDNNTFFQDFFTEIF